MSRSFERSLLQDDVGAATTLSAFVPVLILCLVMTAWFGFQATQLRTDREAMRELMASTDKQLQDSKKLRDSLEAIAHGTAKLAEGGNANARLVVDELKKRGVTINPNPPTPRSEPAAPTK